MKKIYILIAFIFLVSGLTGCGSKEKTLSENLKKIELSGDLVTYEAYYHNVLEYDKKAGTGILNLFEKDRRLFAEYTGTIKYGINLSKVKIDVKGKNINVFIPKASVIGEPNVDKDDFKEENFIESKDGWLNPNPITADDISAAFDIAQNEMKATALANEEVLNMAQKRAKVVLEENIGEFSGLSKDEYVINWEYE